MVTNYEETDNDTIYFDSIHQFFNFKFKKLKFSLIPIQNYQASQKKSKTLLCHDFEGGYGCYDKIKGASISNEANLYTFYYWWNIDIFIYFSHHLITVPPISWSNSAHQHGVPILGTFITENNKGTKICSKIFSSTFLIDSFIKTLVKLCQIYNFDGYLLNFEACVQTKLIKPITYFIKNLRLSLKEKIGSHALVYWYDALVNYGNVHHQNALNIHNKVFFDESDGILLNYWWDNQNLITSFNHAKDRNYDVFVGIDIFARHCIGGWDCVKAVEEAHENQLSIGFFAPGWISEKFPKDDFFKNSFRFWSLIEKFLTTNRTLKMPFDTNFSIGYDEKNDWFCMYKAQLQPFYFTKFSKNYISRNGDEIYVNGNDEIVLFECSMSSLNNSQLTVFAQTSTVAMLFIYLSNNEKISLLSDANNEINQKLSLNVNIDVVKISIKNENSTEPLKLIRLSLK